MPNRNYLSGRRCEHKVCTSMREAGAVVTRSAGSKGLWDVVAVFPGVVWLIQVKRTKSGYWKDANWRALCELELPEGVRAMAMVFQQGIRGAQIFQARKLKEVA